MRFEPPPSVSGDEFFQWTTFREREAGSPQFPLHYDIPPTRYAASQQPWFIDFLHSWNSSQYLLLAIFRMDMWCWYTPSDKHAFEIHIIWLYQSHFYHLVDVVKMDIGELESLLRSQVGRWKSLLVQEGTSAADQILILWPASFDPFFADFPFRVVCRQTGQLQQHSDELEVVCCFYTFSNLFHEVRLRTRAEAVDMLQLVSQLDFVACQGFPEPRDLSTLGLSEVLIDKQKEGRVYRSRQCLYLTSKDFSICNFCAALKKKAEAVAAVSLVQPRQDAASPKVGLPQSTSSVIDCDIAERPTGPLQVRTASRGRPRILTYNCPAGGHCLEAFTNRAEVRRHVKLTHAELFSCEEAGCGKHFSCRKELQLHARRHAASLVPCSLCESRFVSKHKLKLHMTKHTGTGRALLNLISFNSILHTVRLDETIHWL